MGVRFRKSLKIAPGVKLNVGKKSVGVSLGNKAGGVSVNSQSGLTGRVSAPGSGVSYTKKIISNPNASSSPAQPSATTKTEAPPQDSPFNSDLCTVPTFSKKEKPSPIYKKAPFLLATIGFLILLALVISLSTQDNASNSVEEVAAVTIALSDEEAAILKTTISEYVSENIAVDDVKVYTANSVHVYTYIDRPLNDDDFGKLIFDTMTICNSLGIVDEISVRQTDGNDNAVKMFNANAGEWGNVIDTQQDPSSLTFLHSVDDLIALFPSISSYVELRTAS